MGYTSKRGKRPTEYASKSAHSTLINDPAVRSLLARCCLPSNVEAVDIEDEAYTLFQEARPNPITHIVAVDGGYTEQLVHSEFPSATVGFFQIGSLIFSVADLESLDRQQFINPDDMAKLKQIQRFKLTLPARNIRLNGESTLTHSVRRVLYEFFCNNPDDHRFIDTLRWLIFEEFAKPAKPTWTLGSCPGCDVPRVPLHRNEMQPDHSFGCPHCGIQIFLTDVFRLHEVIDDHVGAGGVFGYITTAIEQFVLIHIIRLILNTKPALLHKILFLRDGPLAFFGQTANMHKPMRALVNYLFDQHALYMAGLDKSGAFVEHADEIAQKKLERGSILVPSNAYIYRHIQPGLPDDKQPYGHNTYYGTKLIFRAFNDRVYVVTVPTRTALAQPAFSDLPNLEVILTNVAKLNCDMYDNALIPVALANKLVSLAAYPSSRILQKFAIGTLGSA